MNEVDFFANIAKRLGRSAPLRQAPVREVVGAPAFWREYQLSPSERLSKYREELGKLGGNAEIFANLQDVQQGLRALLQRLSPKNVGQWGGSVLKEWGLDAILQEYSLVTWDPTRNREELISDFAKLDVGITAADYAVAGTGTTMLMCDPYKARSASLLPSVHVVLLKGSQIRTRMGEVLEAVAQRSGDRTQMPSSVNFISGPSRSADIENDLSIGVHGPAAFYVLIWDDEEALA